MNIFRETGVASPMKMAHASGGVMNGNLIDAPGEGKKIVICDIIIHGSGTETFRYGEQGSSTEWFTLEAPQVVNFSAPLVLGQNLALDVASTPGNTLDVLVTYYIED